jgi:hypothetical protein
MTQALYAHMNNKRKKKLSVQGKSKLSKKVFTNDCVYVHKDRQLFSEPIT